jgi:ribosome-binding protein aMBF1 (putative translation factor)
MSPGLTRRFPISSPSLLVSRDDVLRNISKPRGRPSGASSAALYDVPPQQDKGRDKGISDPFVARAAELHRQALEYENLATDLRAQRDQLIRKARERDPKRWSYATLAKALNCSRELIAVIIRNRG